MGVAVDANVEALLGKIQPNIRELMEKTENGSDRSSHCHHVMMALCELGFGDEKLFSLSDGRPFAEKFWRQKTGENALWGEIARTRATWESKGKQRRGHAIGRGGVECIPASGFP